MSIIRAILISGVVLGILGVEVHAAHVNYPLCTEKGTDDSLCAIVGNKYEFREGTCRFIYKGCEYEVEAKCAPDAERGVIVESKGKARKQNPSCMHDDKGATEGFPDNFKAPKE
jgi:hypothetical protein